MLCVVWFKRDLRIHDHLPLWEASRNGPVLPLYVYEPDMLAAPDMASQHVGFGNECLAELAIALEKLGSPLLLQHAGITSVLEEIRRRYGIFTLYTHEETGNALSFSRDKRVAAWCRLNRIEWRQSPTNGVVRRLDSGDEWPALWMERMRQPMTPAPERLVAPLFAAPAVLESTGLLTPARLGLIQPDKPQRQHGGRRLAVMQLRHFFDHHLEHYREAMSVPLAAEQSCSRLSPYLSFGALSVREVLHAVWKARAQALSTPPGQRPRDLLAGLRSFESRLQWRCHSIQKLEAEPEIETRNIHRSADGLREAQFNQEYFERWRHGETGYPLVDAGMKMLAETGWLNFRMRALLVSFSSYQCWNHWREPALHLAQEFLDYEPGIHYPQMQMQSGATGINPVRIYNPVKQAREQDPDGRFVLRWLPQLGPVPLEYLFEPWKMPHALQEKIGVRINIDLVSTDYPAPVVDHEKAARFARETLAALRGEDDVHEEAQRIDRKHGTRNAGREGRTRTARDAAPLTAGPAEERRKRGEPANTNRGHREQLRLDTPDDNDTGHATGKPGSEPPNDPTPDPQLTLGFD